jgi:hypothetical protein
MPLGQRLAADTTSGASLGSRWHVVPLDVEPKNSDTECWSAASTDMPTTASVNFFSLPLILRAWALRISKAASDSSPNQMPLPPLFATQVSSIVSKGLSSSPSTWIKMKHTRTLVCSLALPLPATDFITVGEFLGNVTGYPGVFQSNPRPYPSKPVPASTGMGFRRCGWRVYENPRVLQPAQGFAHQK